MPADKIAEMEERFGKLEEKLRITFNEIERRFEQLRQPSDMQTEERIQELEDLLLLLQLENTKLKEKVGDGLDFGITPNVPDVSERLGRVEAELALRPAAAAPASGDIEAKITALEERINAIPTTTVKVSRDAEKHIKEGLKESMAGDMHLLEKRIRTLEALLEKHGQEEIESGPGVLADVHAILKRS